MLYFYRFFLDGVETMKIDPGTDGFWGLGEFAKTDAKMFNPWESDGDHMAPFDREVCCDCSYHFRGWRDMWKRLIAV